MEKMRIPDAEPIKRSIPESLIPKEDGPRFPELAKKDLLELADKGWKRIGVVVLLLNPDGQVLSVMHGPDNPKVPEGTMGIISETLTFDAQNIEQPLEGISRLLSEEIGLSAADIQSLNLRTVKNGAWQNVTFPLPGNRDALGLVTVLRADQASTDLINRVSSSGSPKGESILFGAFSRPDPLAAGMLKEKFRKGTQEVILAAMPHLTTPEGFMSRVELPPPKDQYQLEDLEDLLP